MGINEISLLIVQIILFGIARGCVYALLALGLNLIFGTMKIVFLSHGAMSVLGAYFVWTLLSSLGIDPLILTFVTLVPFFVIGLFLYRGVFQRTRDPNSSTISSYGLLVALQMIILMAWTANPKTISSPYESIAIPVVGGISILFTRVLLIILCVVTTILLILLLKKSMFGKAVRAVSEDYETSSLMGVDVKKINSLAFSLGIVLSCFAGALFGINYSFDPYIGLLLTFKGFVALTVGGLGSSLGSVVGGVSLGIVENIIAYSIGPVWSDIASYAFFIIVLLTKPSGIFGKRW